MFEPTRITKKGIPCTRKAFIQKTGAVAAGAAALATFPFLRTSGRQFLKEEYTVQDIVDLLINPVEGAPFAKTVDTLKSGNAEQKVTGVVTTMFATVAVMQEAVKRSANFIIVHEPAFYNHTDDKGWVQPNHIVEMKDDFLKENGIAVWRFHDYWHAYKPDGILHGVLLSLGWEKYYDAEKEIIVLPRVSLEELVRHIKAALGIGQVRVIGDASQSCQRIAIAPGAAGGQYQMALIEKTRPDVFICGEVHEWETAEYVRDARMLGSKTSLVILGHSVSEEPGMKWLAEMLQPKLNGIKVHHIATGSPFQWM